MIGLVQIPTIKNLKLAYSRLQSVDASPSDGKSPIPSYKLILWSQWSRFDPRLAEQLVSYWRHHWRDHDPVQLNAEIRKSAWPAATGVLFEHVRLHSRFSASERKLFSAWSKCALVSITPASGELFFIGLRAMTGRLMTTDAEFSLRSYTRWGYLGREVLVNKALAAATSSTTTARTDIPASKRREILRELARHKRCVTVTDYIEAVGGAISRRQAQLDLAKSGLHASGKTRNRFRSLRPSSRR